MHEGTCIQGTLPMSPPVKVRPWANKGEISRSDFPVVQRLEVPLPTQGTRVQLLLWEDPTCLGQLGPCATITEPEL